MTRAGGTSPPAAPAPAVGFVLHSAARDGAGIAFLELLDALPPGGVRAVAFLPARGRLADEIVTRGVPCTIVPYRWWMDRGTPLAKKGVRTAWNAVQAVRLARRLRRAGVELAYSNSLAVAAGAVAARLVGLPHVWHVHELWGRGTGFVFDLGESASLRLVDRLSATCVAVSHAVAARLGAHVDPARVRTVYQSVTVSESVAAAPRSPAEPARCVAVGALYELRRQEEAVRAVALLARDGVDAELLLAGWEEPAYGRRLRLLAGGLGVAERVRFLGPVDHPEAVLASADVVVSCAPVEGFGRATVEAMLLGRPVVAAHGGANDELLAEGRGLLYAAGDAAGLAACLRRLLADRDEGRRVGERARDWAAGRFTRERYGREMAELLTTLARGGSGVGRSRA